MKTKNAEDLLPPQEKGETTYLPASINTHSEQGAIHLFSKARKRLMDVNHWADLCGPLSVIFRLTDASGVPLYGEAATGNYIRINIPGADSTEGQDFDWVKIEKIEYHPVSDAYELFLLQVRPSPDPICDWGGETAHFLEASATSTFIIERDAQYVNAAIYGRNEVPNTSSSRVTDKIRNRTTDASGALLFSKLQWKSLAQGLLKDWAGL